MLIMVFCALSLALAWPTRQFFAQQGQISQLREQARRQQQQVAALEKEKGHWADPAYVKVQARERLHYVMPGETPLVAMDPAPAVDPNSLKSPWYRKLFESLRTASADPAADSQAPSAPVPAPRPAAIVDTKGTTPASTR